MVRTTPSGKETRDTCIKEGGGAPALIYVPPPSSQETLKVSSLLGSHLHPGLEIEIESNGDLCETRQGMGIVCHGEPLRRLL